MATHSAHGMNQTVGYLNKVVETNKLTVSQNQFKVSKRTETIGTGIYRTERMSLLSFVIEDSKMMTMENRDKDHRHRLFCVGSVA